MKRFIVSRRNRVAVLGVLLWGAYLLIAEPWEQSPDQHMSTDSAAGRVAYLPLLAGINIANGLYWVQNRHRPGDIFDQVTNGWQINWAENVSEFMEQQWGFSALRIGVGVLMVYALPLLLGWAWQRPRPAPVSEPEYPVGITTRLLPWMAVFVVGLWAFSGHHSALWWPLYALLAFVGAPIILTIHDHFPNWAKVRISSTRPADHAAAAPDPAATAR